MTLRAYPKLGTLPGTLRVWVGTRQSARAPRLTFTLNGARAEPTTLRPMQSVRPDALLANPPPQRAFSGLFELTGLDAAREHEVRVAADTEPGLAVLRARALPTELSRDPETWFNVLIASCFYAGGDHAKSLKTTLAGIPAHFRPHASLLLGDQVYLDLPLSENFQDDVDWLAQRFERSYAENWFGEHFSPLLSFAPSVCIPDDHEYWNNYPHVAPFIETTFSERGRANWAAAARAMFAGFQLGPPDHLGAPLIFDVAPLSFFVADTRSFRAADRSRSLHPNALAWLEPWAERVRAQRLTGVFVAGQSLFEAKAGALGATLADRALANYADHPSVLASVAKLAAAGRPVVCVTGDVHWGRVLRASDPLSGVARAFEVICSPTSLVDSPWDFANRALHSGSDWPLHSAGDDGPRSFPVGGQRWNCRPIYKRSGDQLAILSFRRFAGAVQLRVSYWPVHARGAVRRPIILEPVALTAPE